jgi:hypothetical protein
MCSELGKKRKGVRGLTAGKGDTYNAADFLPCAQDLMGQ